MPTKNRRENEFIGLFMSAYEDDSWADADLDWVDEKTDGGVELIATRKSDGMRLAIEHTLLEPFVGNKRDFAQFAPVLPAIKDDESLALPGRWTRVFIPVGTLDGHHKSGAREALAAAVRQWLRANRLSLPDGDSQHQCPVPGLADDPSHRITLTIKVSRLGANSPGRLQLGRQQVANDFNLVMGKALRTKLPKLLGARADKRILIFEREDFNFFTDQILDEIKNQRPTFQELARVDEIWILETVGYKPGGHFQLDLHEGKKVTASLQFEGGRLTGRSKNGWPVLV